MNEKITSYLKKYLLAFGVMGIATLFILWIREHSSADVQSVRYLNLADAFLIPGVIIIMVGLLVWVANEGAFDMLAYGLSRAKNSFIPSPRYKDEKFYDYKMRKAEKRVKGYSFLFISGGVYLIPAIIFNVLYYTAK